MLELRDGLTHIIENSTGNKDLARVLGFIPLIDGDYDVIGRIYKVLDLGKEIDYQGTKQDNLSGLEDADLRTLSSRFQGQLILMPSYFWDLFEKISRDEVKSLISPPPKNHESDAIACLTSGIILPMSIAEESGLPRRKTPVCSNFAIWYSND